ncbi:MAG: hypothetical protein R3D80_03445 [Paracoccaceae bacterium]
MFPRAALAAALALPVSPALAGTTCTFDVECYQTDPCAASGWELSVDLAAGTISSVAEDLEILHATPDGLQIVARGEGSLNLLTIGETASLFTSHIAGAPTVLTYVGECAAQ